MESVDEWAVIAAAEMLRTSGDTQSAHNELKKLPDTFAHKHYLRSVLHLDMVEHESAYQSIMRAIALSGDDQRSLYLQQLFRIPWSSQCQIHKLIESAGLTQPLDTLSNSCLEWNFPLVDPFEVEIDADLLEVVVRERQLQDSLKNQDMAGWTSVILEDESTEGRLLLSQRLDSLIGATGMQRPRIGKVIEYFRFLSRIPNSPWSNQLPGLGAKIDEIYETDLGSQMDVLLLSQFEQCCLTDNAKRNILEIGGGYGRLAEAMLRNAMFEIDTYYMVDAVPSSITAACSYLRSAMPDNPIFLHLLDEVVEVNGGIKNATKVRIVPSWNTDFLGLRDIDIAINIESFQEMSVDAVQSWVSFIDKLLKTDGLAYVSNSRSYVNRSAWTIPSSWRSLLCTETPRSWTIDHPTEIFQKVDRDLLGIEAISTAMTMPWRFPVI